MAQAGDILANYIYELQNQQRSISTDFVKLINERKGFLVLAPLKRRLFNFGIDGNENKIGSGYSGSTIRQKRKLGLRTSPITLRWSGGWYESMDAKANRFGEIEITATKSVKGGLLTDILEEKYGDAILKLTPKEQEDIAKIVEQEILTKFENIKIPQIEFI
jgi:hypothetical protein